MLGKFISVEGIDGSGKTTVSEYIANFLIEKGHKVLVTREPGGTGFSEKIRGIIFDENIDATTETLLFAASRREHVEKKIKPALKEGFIVICDRFLDSSIAYQSYAGGVTKEDVLLINTFAIGNFSPDLTLYFDVEIETGLSRQKDRVENNRFDNESLEFYKKLKKAYDDMATEDRSRVIRIDANKELAEVQESVCRVIEEVLEKWQTQ